MFSALGPCFIQDATCMRRFLQQVLLSASFMNALLLRIPSSFDLVEPPSRRVCRKLKETEPHASLNLAQRQDRLLTLEIGHYSFARMMCGELIMSISGIDRFIAHAFSNSTTATLTP